MRKLEVVKGKLAECLSERKSALELPLCKRAKFEGWLKVEFASAIRKDQRFRKVKLEGPYLQNKRADLSFSLGDARFVAEIKTCNTNYRMKGISPRRRPITKNIKGVIRDINSLRGLKEGAIGLAIMVLFPVDKGMANAQPRDQRLDRFLTRIENATGYGRGSLKGDFIHVLGRAGMLSYIIEVRPKLK